MPRNEEPCGGTAGASARPPIFGAPDENFGSFVIAPEMNYDAYVFCVAKLCIYANLIRFTNENCSVLDGPRRFAIEAFLKFVIRAAKAFVRPFLRGS